MTTSETGRLAALERTLVEAAARQAERRRVRARRAVGLSALAAPLFLAAAASLAATGMLGGIDPRIAAMRAEHLGVAPGQSPGLPAGSFPSHRMPAVTTAGGSFCFVFGALTGGCLQPGMLTADVPVGLATGYGPAWFRLYGLAADGVTAVSVRARGVTRPALMGRNTFSLQDDSLGGRGRLSGTLIVRMRGGLTRRVPFAVDRYNMPRVLPSLAGFAPAANTAA